MISISYRESNEGSNQNYFSIRLLRYIFWSIAMLQDFFSFTQDTKMQRCLRQEEKCRAWKIKKQKLTRFTLLFTLEFLNGNSKGTQNKTPPCGFQLCAAQISTGYLGCNWIKKKGKKVSSRVTEQYKMGVSAVVSYCFRSNPRTQLPWNEVIYFFQEIT